VFRSCCVMSGLKVERRVVDEFGVRRRKRSRKLRVVKQMLKAVRKAEGRNLNGSEDGRTTGCSCVES
jgi:hypothetical protein